MISHQLSLTPRINKSCAISCYFINYFNINNRDTTKSFKNRLRIAPRPFFVPLFVSCFAIWMPVYQIIFCFGNYQIHFEFLTLAMICVYHNQIMLSDSIMLHFAYLQHVKYFNLNQVYAKH